MTLGETFRSLPKVLLHDHLDGGLRPRRSSSWRATSNTRRCRRPIRANSQTGSIAARSGAACRSYLEGFAHTCGVMQTAEALERVAYEMMEDMHDDGVVYVETRFAPVFHTAKGCTGTMSSPRS